MSTGTVSSVKFLMDKYLITDRCCFCTDIRTGGLIMGFLGITIEILMILGGLVREDTDALILILPIIGLALNSCFVYGIINNKAKFLLPEVILSVISFGILAFAGAIATVLTCGLALIFLIPFGAIFWHFTSVKYSLYLKMDDENMQHPGAVYYASEKPLAEQP